MNFMHCFQDHIIHEFHELFSGPNNSWILWIVFWVQIPHELYELFSGLSNSCILWIVFRAQIPHELYELLKSEQLQFWSFMDFMNCWLFRYALNEQYHVLNPGNCSVHSWIVDIWIVHEPHELCPYDCITWLYSLLSTKTSLRRDPCSRPRT